MNGHWLLNPTATSVKMLLYSNIFMQDFCFALVMAVCIYIPAMKLKSSHNATMAFVSYAISLLWLAEMCMQLICMQAIV